MGITILLVDDHRMLRDGLRAILEKDGLTVVGEAATGHEAISQAAVMRPDVVVMDIAMPGLNGVDATRRIVTELPGTKVIALSMSSDRRYVLAMFAAGAVGYVQKSSASDELIRAVHNVAAGHKYVSPSVAEIVVEHLVDSGAGSGPASASAASASAIKPLSPREREVLQLLAEGKSSKEIAQCLGVAVATVETHRRQIMGKLNLRTVAELTKYAIREGLTTLEA